MPPCIFGDSAPEELVKRCKGQRSAPLSRHALNQLDVRVGFCQFNVEQTLTITESLGSDARLMANIGVVLMKSCRWPLITRVCRTRYMETVRGKPN